MDEKVHVAIGRLSRLSNPGHSGHRPEYLSIVWSTPGPDAERTRHVFVAPISAALRGHARGGALSQATLALIPRPDGSLRPIGMGEVVRKVAGRLALQAITPSLSADLAVEGQHGLLRHGAAMAYRKATHLAASGKWILQIDIRNAFNEVTREAVLAGAPAHPAVAPLVATLYGKASEMLAPLHGSFTVTRGVIQGCPLASALFATALGPAVRAANDDLLRLTGERMDSVWYADDGTVAQSSLDVIGHFLRARLGAKPKP